MEVELATRIELVTSSLPRKYSTTEPRERNFQGYRFEFNVHLRMERAKRFELSTSTLEGWRSTN
jgi:hypothetical protein